MFFIALFVMVVCAGGYWFTATTTCPIPLSYRLGSYDERFLLTPDAVRETLVQVEGAWEAALGRDVFRYDPEARFVVDFVFDERQRRALSAEAVRSDLDAQAKATEKARQELAALSAQYDSQRVAYEAAVREYEDRLQRHNQAVERSNAAGGATGQALAALERSRAELTAEAAMLERKAAALEQVIEDINAKGEAGNALASAYNRAVDAYNERYAEAGAFTQGEYQGNRIVIYKYTDAQKLAQVLGHEFGHALGVGHVEDPGAIMYYLLEQQPDSLTITPADRAAAEAVCGTGTEWSHWLRYHVRSALPLLFK